MLGRARVTATWGNAPSAAEIRKLDQERLLQNPILTEAGSEDDLAMADELLKSRDARTIAAAFVKMYRAGLPAPEEIEENVPPYQQDRPRRERGDRPEREDRPERAPRERRDHAPRESRDYAPRESRDHQADFKPRPGDMENGVWFRLNVGRGRNADPKWLLPEICRQGDVTKKDIGAIRVFDTETLFQVDAKVAAKFGELVSERKKLVNSDTMVAQNTDNTGEKPIIMNTTMDTKDKKWNQ
jgi:ATP-dependent RNA helicase DeaD